MSEIKHILLIPAEGDPHGLLKEGPCGARPPMAWYCGDYQAWEQWHRGMDHAEPCARAAMVERARCALVLAWDGQPVAEGLDRANRVWVGRWCGLLHEWTMGNVREYGAAVVIHLGGGTLVLIDAERREVSDVRLEGQ